MLCKEPPPQHLRTLGRLERSGLDIVVEVEVGPGLLWTVFAGGLTVQLERNLQNLPRNAT